MSAEMVILLSKPFYVAKFILLILYFLHTFSKKKEKKKNFLRSDYLAITVFTYCLIRCER